jgi:hypothetical protein
MGVETLEDLEDLVCGACEPSFAEHPGCTGDFAQLELAVDALLLPFVCGTAAWRVVMGILC